MDHFSSRRALLTLSNHQQCVGDTDNTVHPLRAGPSLRVCPAGLAVPSALVLPVVHPRRGGRVVLVRRGCLVVQVCRCRPFRRAGRWDLAFPSLPCCRPHPVDLPLPVCPVGLAVLAGLVVLSVQVGLVCPVGLACRRLRHRHSCPAFPSVPVVQLRLVGTSCILAPHPSRLPVPCPARPSRPVVPARPPHQHHPACPTHRPDRVGIVVVHRTDIGRPLDDAIADGRSRAIGCGCARDRRGS